MIFIFVATTVKYDLTQPRRYLRNAQDLVAFAQLYLIIASSKVDPQHALYIILLKRLLFAVVIQIYVLRVSNLYWCYKWDWAKLIYLAIELQAIADFHQHFTTESTSAQVCTGTYLCVTCPFHVEHVELGSRVKVSPLSGRRVIGAAWLSLRRVGSEVPLEQDILFSVLMTFTCSWNVRTETIMDLLLIVPT